MKISGKHLATLAIAGSLASTLVVAETKQAKLELIGEKYTPWGALIAGNEEGTIPAYKRSIEVPESYDPANPGIRPNPFADEKPLFSIDKSNMAEHSDKLSDGIKAMLEKYPGYRLDIYPTHRTARYPELYEKNAIKNVTECEAVEGGLVLDGCYAGTPFPFPESGSEVMWNRLLKFDQYAFSAKGQSAAIVDSSGDRTLNGVSTMSIQYPIFDPERTKPIGRDEIYEVMKLEYYDPARKNGEKIIIHDYIDMVNNGRKAWQYLPGQRRVKLSPDLSYDTPSPTGGGASVTDEFAVFYGAIDKYDWELVGKKEMFIPYNAYKARDPEVCPDEVTESTKNYLNPDCVRWELHRVWEVKGTLADGERHIYPERVLYWDEDLPGVGIGDAYDAAGDIYRVTHSLPITFYEDVGHMTDEAVTYDLKSGAYTRQQNATMHGGWTISEPESMIYFSPQSMAGGGIR